MAKLYFSTEDIQRILTLRDRNLPCRYIGEIMGCSGGSIFNICNDHYLNYVEHIITYQPFLNRKVERDEENKVPKASPVVLPPPILVEIPPPKVEFKKEEKTYKDYLKEYYARHPEEHHTKALAKSSFIK